MIIAGKDKFCDNARANLWYRQCGTPAAKKSIKQFPNAYHEIHKEEDCKIQYYETIYKFIAK